MQRQPVTTLARVEALEERILLTIDLASALFLGWDDSIIVSNVPGTNADSTEFTTNGTVYVDIGWGNFGDMPTGSEYTITLQLDGVEVHSQTTGPHEPGFGDFLEDFELNALSAGQHTLTLSLDTLNQIAESNENNNVDTKTFTVVEGEPSIIIDNGDAGYSSTGFHPLPDANFPDPEGRDGDIENSGQGTGADVATWTFSGLTAGTYRVSATWSGGTNRATNAPYSITDGGGGTLLRQTLVNQKLDPSDFVADGSAWEDLGVVTITADTLVVTLSDAANGYVIADAIRIVQAPLTPPPDAFIIDDGDAGYFDTGWAQSPMMEGRLNDIRYQAAGNGSQTANWSFTGLAPGHYTISATWSPNPNRATNAPFTVIDGAGGDQLALVSVNQQAAPDDFSSNGSLWEELTTVTVTGSELVVELSNAANGYVIADAIRIAPSPIAPPPPARIIDDGDAGYADTGWTHSTTEGRLNDLRYTSAGNGSQTATWTFTGLTPGNYRVSATWAPHTNRASNAPFTLYDGTGGDMLETVRVNQELAPDDLVDNGSSWEHLAVVNITGTELVVELTNDANQYVIADALRVEATPDEPPLPPGTIVDDGDAGFSTTTGWDTSSMTEGRDGDIRYAAAGNGSRVATWTFPGLIPGTYRVSATWSPHTNRASDAPYTILDGDTAIETIDINQRVAPDDFSNLGSSWEDLATEVEITSGTLNVELSNNANGFVIADAIRVQLIEASDGGGGGDGGTNERLVLGPSDNIALDQPRVTVLLTEDLEGNRQVGPFIFNGFLLDTGANGILAMASAVSEMDDGPYVYRTEGEHAEQGVSGLSLFDISAPYYFYYAADGNGYVPEPPLIDTRVLSHTSVDFSFLGPWGIGGMPLMDGRVVELDYSGWSGGLEGDLGNIFMVTTFMDELPPGQNRFSIPVDNRLRFDPEEGVISGDHPPTYSDIPFLSATISNEGVDRDINLVLDTGAQAGILSSEVGLELGLDSNGDGVLTPEDENFVETLVIGGVGGEIEAHMFFIEEVSIPTEQGVDLVWTDLGWLILDIETPEDQPSLDGVFGSELLTSGWVNAIFQNPPGPDGFIQKAYFDFREWAETGNATMYLDLTTTESAAGPTGAAFVPSSPKPLASSLADFNSFNFDPDNGPIPGTALHRLLYGDTNQVFVGTTALAGAATNDPLSTGIANDENSGRFAAVSTAGLSATSGGHEGMFRPSAGGDGFNLASRDASGMAIGSSRDSDFRRADAEQDRDASSRWHRGGDFESALARLIESGRIRRDPPRTHDLSAIPNLLRSPTAVSLLELDAQQITASALTHPLE